VSEVLWVPVPGGLDGTQAVVQVLVVPRLQGGRLADFGMQDWPGVLESATFEVRTKTSEGIQTVDAAVTYRNVARSELWQAFFGGDAGLVNEFGQKTYPVPDVADTYRDASDVVGTYQTSAKALAVPDPDTPAMVRQQLETWFDPAPLPPPPPSPPIPPHTPADFHGTVAMLREHPAVLRQLGLVFDVTLDRSALDVGAPDTRFLSIRCPDPPLSFLVTAPWTHYLLTSGQFVPAPSPGAAADIRAGLLNLGRASAIVAPPGPDEDDPPPPPRWAVSTFDVDGIVGRLRDAAKSARESDTGDAPALPHIRTGGLMLVRPGRADDFAGRVATAAANARLESAADAEFHAEDLVLGYRVDVRMGDDPHWHPLCARQARYGVNGLPIAPAEAVDGDGFHDEEGHVKANAAIRDPDRTLRADQVVVRWDGWSLAVPRPNLLDNTAGAARKPGVELPYEFEWSYRLRPSSLPPLRFSRRYSMRARIADLAGGGLGTEHQSTGADTTETILYLRHEPLAAPVLQARAEFAAGAAVDRLVIRSDFGKSVAETSAADPGYPAADRRELLPPQTTFAIAEQHGEFDHPEDERTRNWAERALTVFSETGEAAERGLPDPAVNGVNAVLAAEPGGVAEPLSERSAWAPAWPEQADKAIELVEGQADDPISLQWAGDRLVVRLAQAEQVRIALSSTIRDGYIDHFAMFDWLARADVPDVSLVEAQNGGHPLLSPPRVVHLVHAVRRPLAEPQWRLPPDAIFRDENDTTALLSPRFSGDGLNTDSTVALDVAAQWTVRSDSGVEQVTVDRLHTEPIARGEPAFSPMRHSFGDTRHRMVTYTLTAVSRFREFYGPAEPGAAFRVTKTQQPVSIVSSARPPAPVVLSARPAFRWERTTAAGRIEHVRRGGLLRIELARPWFETGDGEQLAVVTAIEEPPEEHAGLVTRIGRDPLFASPELPPFPAADWFAGHADEVFLPEIPARVRAVPFAVTEAGDRWFADVGLTLPVPSYNPFVQLAVARYQPESLRGLELSTVVVTDLVPVLPDRTLVVTKEGDVARVELSGTMPEPRTGLDVVVEEHVPAAGEHDLILLGGGPEVPGWVPVQGLTATDGVTTTVDLSRLGGAGPLRLRVREIDLPGATQDVVTPELNERSPFVDLVPLPAEWLPRA
jgi:hypothetical protein